MRIQGVWRYAVCIRCANDRFDGEAKWTDPDGPSVSAQNIQIGPVRDPTEAPLGKQTSRRSGNRSTLSLSLGVPVTPTTRQPRQRWLQL